MPKTNFKFIIILLMLTTAPYFGMSQDNPKSEFEINENSEMIKGTIRNYIIQFKLDSAIIWIDKALPLIEPDSEFEASLYRYKGICYDYLEKDDSVTYFLDKARHYYYQEKDYVSLSEVYVDYGGFYHYELMRDSAIYYYLLAENINSKYGKQDPEISGTAFNNVALIKDGQGDHEIAEDYYFKAISCYKEMEDESRARLKINTSYSNLIKCYRNQKKYAIALHYSDIMISTANQSGDSLSFATALSSKSKLFYALGDYRSSVDAAALGYVISKNINSPYITPLIYDLVVGYRELGLLDSSLYYNTIGLEMSVAEQNFHHKASFHENFHYTYASLENYEKAYEHLFEYTELMDKELSLEKFTAVEELERKFRNEQQAGEIIRLTHKNEIQKLYVVILVILILLASVLAYFISRKRKISHDLELAKQKSKISESVLQGQENERNRISIELHDSVGASLANASMRISSYLDRITDLNESDLLALKESVDTTCQEVRTISHDLAPYKIEKEGLQFAIEDLLGNLNTIQETRFKSSFSIDENQIPALSKSIIYRIIQELTANTCKHAKASSATIRIETTSDNMIIQVHDDGIGFEQDKASEGIGLKNVANRIAYLRGKMEIVTQKGYGVLFTLKVPYNN